MIFVTVGGQLPFDRLVYGVDNWASHEGRGDVFAQIGNSDQPPTHIEWERFLPPDLFQTKVRDARVLVAHAGIGSILSAIELNKPIVVMPRRAHLGEHRNDHQWATVTHLAEHAGITVATTEEELFDKLGGLTQLSGPPKADMSEYLRLINFLRREITA